MQKHCVSMHAHQHTCRSRGIQKGAHMLKRLRMKRITNNSVSTVFIALTLMCSAHAQSHALHPASPSHPHTCTNSCFIDNITYFLPTVIWLLNCLQSVSPGNSWASSALFSTPNKDSFLIGPAFPLSLFSHTNQIFCLQS